MVPVGGWLAFSPARQTLVTCDITELATMKLQSDADWASDNTCCFYMPAHGRGHVCSEQPVKPINVLRPPSSLQAARGVALDVRQKLIPPKWRFNLSDARTAEPLLAGCIEARVVAVLLEGFRPPLVSWSRDPDRSLSPRETNSPGTRRFSC